MKGVPLDLSFLRHTSSTAVSKTKQLSPNSAAHQPRRNNRVSSTSPLPIITLSSFSNFEEKLRRMTANNDQPNLSPTVLVESLTAQIRTRAPLSNRSNGSSTISRSSLNYPSTLTRTIAPHRSVNEQLNDRCLHVSKPPMFTHRTHSARASDYTTSRSPRQSSSVNRSATQCDHFLTYLRRQSLARTRRMHEDEEEAGGNTETTRPLTLDRTLLSQQFQLASKSPPASSFINGSSMAPMPSGSRPLGRSTSTFRPLQRSGITYHTNQASKIRTATAKASNGGQLLTPANSVVNDGAMAPVKAPYELHEKNDQLSYSYISDSGVRYQGQMLSTSA